MFSELLHKQFSLISYIFFNSLLSGLVLSGVCSSFSLMLSEKGVGVATITTLLLTTIPYSWRFLLSPFIKNIIIEYTLKNKNIIKSLSFFSQAVIFVSFSCLGLFERPQKLWIAGILMFLLVIATCVQDILRDYLKLVVFKTKELGIVSAVENTGFRIGMFIAGACIIYIANFSSWRLSFFIVGSLVILATIATLFIKQEDISNVSEISINIKGNLLRQYVKSCLEFLKQYRFIILTLVIISFKLTDSCINVLKPMFLHHLGVSRTDFANMTHVMGIFSTIISGIIAGNLLYKIGMKNCVKITFLFQMIASLIFIYFSAFKTNLLTITVLVNVASFIFGFSNVVFRTFTAESAAKDINIYTLLLSFGSLIRVLSYTFAGTIVDVFSWEMIYFICLLSNVPGLFLYLNLKRKLANK